MDISVSYWNVYQWFISFVFHKTMSPAFFFIFFFNVFFPSHFNDSRQNLKSLGLGMRTTMNSCDKMSWCEIYDWRVNHAPLPYFEWRKFILYRTWPSKIQDFNPSCLNCAWQTACIYDGKCISKLYIKNIKKHTTPLICTNL